MTRPLIRILIADPHPILRRGVKALLDSYDCYQVVGEAENAAEALRLAEELTPTVVVLAYSLPDLNGVELARKMLAECPRVRVAIHTNVATESVIIAALEAGAKAFILKTDPDMDLLAAIDAICLDRHYISKGVSSSLLERFLQPRAKLSQGCVTPRERDVVQLLAEGRTNKQVANLIDVSSKTVETHRAHVMEKMDLRTTADLVRFAIRNDIVRV